MQETINQEEAAKAQVEYCQNNTQPLFAGSTGECFSCKKDIYDVITVEVASTGVITGCPHCQKSFCC